MKQNMTTTTQFKKMITIDANRLYLPKTAL